MKCEDVTVFDAAEVPGSGWLLSSTGLRTRLRLMSWILLGNFLNFSSVKRGESQYLAHWVAMEFKDLIDVQQLE